MKAIFGIVGLGILVSGVWFWRHRTDAPRIESASSVASNATEAKPAPDQTFTMAQVAEHKDRSSCYTVIRGMVYDVTAFIDKHPGGDMNILRSCGVDATAAFEAKHGGQEKPEATLAGFVIGTLAQ